VIRSLDVRSRAGMHTCAPPVAPAKTGCCTKKLDSIRSEEPKDPVPGMHGCEIARRYAYLERGLLVLQTE
jgi:hypothetical protein